MNASRENQLEPWKPNNIVLEEPYYITDAKMFFELLEVDLKVIDIMRDIIWKDRYGHS